MMTKRIFSYFIVFFLFLSLSARASDKPFTPGEKLKFTLSWEFVPAGEATLSVGPMSEINGEPAYHFIMTAKTNSFVDLFYKVRDRIESYTDVAMTHSVFYKKKQREGKRKRNTTVDFDWKNNQALRIKDEKKRSSVALEPGAFDPLAVFYFVRASNLETGMVLERPVSDGNRCVIGLGHIIKRETITVAAGTFDTFLIEPDLKDIKGVFEKSKDASIQIWVTADRHHIPVKIQSKVVVGRFIGELKEASIPEAD